MGHGVKIFNAACKGCVNCIKSCPTEAIRVVDGRVRIIPELCIDCGECLRTCTKKALGMDEDDWDTLRTAGDLQVMSDPTLYAQLGSYRRPGVVRDALSHFGVREVASEVPLAYDVGAYAIARALEEAEPGRKPLISTYCPAIVRLVQVRFPELLPRLVPVESPLEIAGQIWRRDHRDSNLTLVAPCPAKITLVREPVGREKSSFTSVVAVKRVTRDLLASGATAEVPQKPMENIRWLMWALRGGETRHVTQFLDRPVKTMVVSGLRNTLDLLQELELGHLPGVDYVECRVCDLGCIGGIGNAETRFLSEIRLRELPVRWELTEHEFGEVQELYDQGIWKLKVSPRATQSRTLGKNVAESMNRLQKLKKVYDELPHIDCGACGRPTCHALAEDIVRGEGEVTDCIFKLRDRISTLAREIADLSGHVPHTLRNREED
ncbi:MAG: 4Fe-4S dicluster domain-containing protein [Synergistales bacterium]|nr:4Fe-4S dicluster domain-containing protein [Synergistales bacterium]